MDDEEKRRVRDVTKTLADLDVFFSKGEAENVPTWVIPFTEGESGGGQLNVHVQLHQEWLVIYHQIGGGISESQSFPSEMMKQLLELNGRLAIAKVALTEGNEVVVTAQIAFGRLSADSLKEAVGAVLAGARKVRELLGIPAAGVPPATKH
jgi:hypothetical protein